MNEMSHSKPDISPKMKYSTVVSSGQSALKAFLTMNGGASLAFLAFIGNAVREHSLNEQAGGILVHAMQGFIYGTFMAVLAFGTIFLTNCLSIVNWERSSNVMFGITLACAFASAGCFLYGSATAVKGFTDAHLFSGKQTPPIYAPSGPNQQEPSFPRTGAAPPTTSRRLPHSRRVPAESLLSTALV